MPRRGIVDNKHEQVRPPLVLTHNVDVSAFYGSDGSPVAMDDSLDAAGSPTMVQTTVSTAGVRSSAVDDAQLPTESEYFDALTAIAAEETAAASAKAVQSANQGRAVRSAAAAAAAEKVAQEVVRTAGAVQMQVAAAATRTALTASEAATFAAESVLPGNEASAAQIADRSAAAVAIAARATAEEAVLAAVIVARAAAVAASGIAAVAADTETTTQLVSTAEAFDQHTTAVEIQTPLEASKAWHSLPTRFPEGRLAGSHSSETTNFEPATGAASSGLG